MLMRWMELLWSQRSVGALAGRSWMWMVSALATIFQFAWSSGMIAGRCAAGNAEKKSIEKEKHRKKKNIEKKRNINKKPMEKKPVKNFLEKIYTETQRTNTWYVSFVKNASGTYQKGPAFKGGKRTSYPA